MKIKKTNSRWVVLFVLFAFYSCGPLATDSDEALSTGESNDSSFALANDQGLSEEQRALYRADAEKLAVRYINEKDATQADIPADLINQLYNGLIHIVNSDLAQAQAATQTYPVHAYSQPLPRQVLVFADSTASWVEPWRNEITETSNAQVDDLIDRFDLVLIDFNELQNTLPTVMATLRSDRAVNVFAVGRQLQSLDDIDQAYPNYVTDGSDITVLFFDNFLRFTFEYRYGDCPSGCISQHSWKFSVYNDGTVEFVNEQGDTLPAD